MKIMLFQMAFDFMQMTYLNILTCIHYHRTGEQNWVSVCIFVCSQSQVSLLRFSIEQQIKRGLLRLYDLGRIYLKSLL